MYSQFMMHGQKNIKSSNNVLHPLMTFLFSPNILFNLPSRLWVHNSLSYRTGKILWVFEYLHFLLPYTKRKVSELNDSKHFLFNLFVNEILICCCHIQSPELSHIFITLIIQLLLCCINVTDLTLYSYVPYQSDIPFHLSYFWHWNNWSH